MNKAREIAHDIIDLFEQFLEKHNIVIPNNDKENNSDASNIYGEDYYNLEDDISKLIVEYCKGKRK